MGKLIRTIAAFGAAFAACFSVAACAEPKAPSPAIVAAKPALWQVSDLDTTIYLFGTIHALPPGIEWFGGRVENAFGRSHELVTEIIDPPIAELQASVMSKAMLPAGKTLRELMTDSDRKEYEAVIGTLGFPPTTFDRFDPWYAAVGLSTLPLMREGFKTAHGVEEVLEARAKQAGIPQIALETFDYQIGLFDSLPIDLQLRYLDDVVEAVPTLAADLAAMVEAWKQGDPEHLAALINTSEDNPELLRILLVDRNANWARWIDERLDRPGIVFLAVGAGHLAGTGSVQEQLARRGFATRRLQ